ncbi:MAG: hypothetical protein SF187_02115 [Deltaproteobacteria bacterium]|nr:hypothetical protein [Deltaproteobacteria bacterium]
MRGVPLLALYLLSCGGLDPDPGRDALMAVEGALFIPGDFPAGSGGPVVTSVIPARQFGTVGEVDLPLRGTLAPEATAVALGAEGDRGYWRLLAAPPDVSLPGQPVFDVRLAFSRLAHAGPLPLLVSAADDHGRFGPVVRSVLTLAERPSPQGRLVVSLSWDRDADLDLRVVDPRGVVLWSRDPNTAMAVDPTSPLTNEERAAGGVLDIDSNAACRIDGMRVEHASWQTPPPGRYRVLVDTMSMCGQSEAHWLVQVRRDGAVVAAAEGVSLPVSTRFEHGAEAGVLALQFDL